MHSKSINMITATYSNIWKLKRLPGAMILLVVTVFTLWGSTASAFPSYSNYENDYDSTTGSCATCHGGFRIGGDYLSLTEDDPASWGSSLRDYHDTMFGLGCNDCHGNWGRLPVYTTFTPMATGGATVMCTTCHGRIEDGPQDDPNNFPHGPMASAGLRQHHWNANVAVNPNTGQPFPNGWTTQICADCHLDSNPAFFTPVGEHIPSTNYITFSVDPCNEQAYNAGARLGQIPGLTGLDQDGDLCRDGSDPDCPNGGSAGLGRDCVINNGDCGNGILDPGEACDDGNNISGDGCSGSCLSDETCGNGFIDTTIGENCDDGNTTGSDGCPSNCIAQDPIANAGPDFTINEGDVTIVDATGSYDPDGYIVSYLWTGAAASYLDDVTSPTPTLTAPAVNTNNTLTLYVRVTDDDSLTGTDSLRVTVLDVIVCGDGIIDAGETCDDGNTADGDGCDSSCQIEPGCGNGILDPGEECDDSNTVPGDGCDANCKLEPYCGDGKLDPGEECDDGNISRGDGCSSFCTIEACGNGILDAGEQCDDGNTNSGDGCTANCALENYCGNGILEEGEECDDGNISRGDGCSSFCTIEVCGNGLLDVGENCDDGNTVGGDGCGANCILEICGNGILDPGEECDDNSPSCKDDCTLIVCGDGIIEAPVENCDDGNLIDGDGCSSTCWNLDPIANAGPDQVVNEGDLVQLDGTASYDPDGAIASYNWEVTGVILNDPTSPTPSFIAPEVSSDYYVWATLWVTDNGGFTNLFLERALITILDTSGSVCGNGIVEAGEACDDGNTSQVCDGCSSDCQVVTSCCGNGIVDPGEACDDGNITNGDGCDVTCYLESDGTQTCTGKKKSPVCVDNVCGDGTVNQSFEQCDDGNNVNGDGCSAYCQWEGTPPGECGNGVLETGEECDDGNLMNGDGCSSSCTIEPSTGFCGDGNRDKGLGEDCDDGNTISGDGCSSTCQREKNK